MPAKPPSGGGRNVSRREFIRTSAFVGGSGVVGSAAVARAAAPPAPAQLRGGGLDVRDFGAVGDGRTDDTPALQAALDAADRLGGGRVSLPAGTWRSGTLHLRSRVTLELTAGAVLLASRNGDDFDAPDAPGFATRSDVETVDFAHGLLTGRDLERVAIVGQGVVDMNRRARSGPKPIALKRCRFVTIQGVTILHAPNYGVSLGGCDDVLVDGVTIRHAYADGIDPDCCRRVRISNCDIEADDDALCLKTSFLLGRRATTEDVVVTNCRMRSPSNCFKLGTESSGDFRQIAVSNCVFSGRLPDDHDASAAAEGGGIAILTVDGGTIDGVLVSNVVMSDVPAPIFVRLGNRGRDQEQRVPGRLRNVSISGVLATGAVGTGSICGLPGHPIERLTLDNVRITSSGGARRVGGLDVPERADDYPRVTMYGALPAFGLYVRHAQETVLRNVTLDVERPDARAALVADDVAGLRVTSVSGTSGKGGGPSVWLNDVRDGVVQGNTAFAEERGVFLRVSGERTRSVVLVGARSPATGPLDLAPNLDPGAVTHVADMGM